MRDDHHPEVGELELATVMQALADPVRLQIVGELAGGAELTCSTIGAALHPELAKSTRSHHLRVLREAGLTRTRHEGVFKYVGLRDADLAERFPGLLDAVLASLASPARG